MKCDTATELLMEASHAELRGEADSEIARHVRRCPRCRRLAVELLEADEGLGRALEGLLEARSDEEILQAARRELARGAVGDDAPTAPLRRRHLWRIGAPLAAAAALAAVILLTDGPEPGARVGEAPVPPRLAEERSVDVQADRRFAMMKTEDPKIHVVWFY